MKTTLTAILALAAGAALAEGDLTVSAWILPRGLVPGAPIVVATSDAEARGDGFGLFLGDDGALRAYAGAASAAENVAVGLPDETAAVTGRVFVAASPERFTYAADNGMHNA